MGIIRSKPKNTNAVIVMPNGGLGNQLFQIANGYAYSLRYDKRFFICKCWKGMSKTRPSYWRNICIKALPYLIHPRQCKKTTRYIEKQFSYQEIPFQNINIVLEGYYQSEKYFLDYEKEIRDLFIFPEEILKKISFKRSDKICIAVHIRRGDYLISSNKSFHISMDKDYYDRAKKKIQEKLGFEPIYYYFSDDIEWIKESFQSDMKEEDKIITGYKDYEELIIMSQCDHFVIANSTFSWWAAWLSQTQPKKKKIVIAPNVWFGPKGPQDYQDIYCEGWIQVFSGYNPKYFLPKKINWRENVKAYYINLEHRLDRKQSIERELSPVFADYERFDAIKENLGFIGVAKSQIAVLEKGLLQEKDYIAIFEDDFVWNLTYRDIIPKLDRIFEKDFNVVLLSYNIVCSDIFQVSNLQIGFFNKCQMASGYVICKNFIPSLLENFKESLAIMEKTKNDKCAIDQNWKKLQKKENKFYVSLPQLGKQLPSWSDIEKKEVSYGGFCFMGILNCEKYKDRRLRQDLSKCPFEYRYFIGNPSLTEPVENFEEKTVYLPCKDDYKSLTDKVYQMIRWIMKHYPRTDYIFKTDDDIIFHFGNLLRNFKFVYVNNIDYAGHEINIEKDTNSTYLRDHENDPNEPLLFIPKTKYCAGGGYFLSKRSIQVILENMMKQYSPLEDQSVGYCLNQKGIYPKNIKTGGYACLW